MKPLNNMTEVLYKCKLDNRWYWSAGQGGLLIDSPSGGCIWIPKGRFCQMDNKSEEERELVLRLGELREEMVDLTREEMQLLVDVANRCPGGIVRKGRNVVTVDGVRVVRSEVLTAPQKGVPQRKSFQQRKAESLKRIENMNRSILSGCCPNASCNNRYGLQLRHHSTWVGYFCTKCNLGGSVTIKK